jgi:hypothetical protein
MLVENVLMVGRTDRPIPRTLCPIKKKRVVKSGRVRWKHMRSGYMRRVRDMHAREKELTVCFICWLNQPGKPLAACTQGRRLPYRTCPLLPSD